MQPNSAKARQKLRSKTKDLENACQNVLVLPVADRRFENLSKPKTNALPIPHNVVHILDEIVRDGIE